jgi:hypothetical protein
MTILFLITIHATTSGTYIPSPSKMSSKGSTAIYEFPAYQQGAKLCLRCSKLPLKSVLRYNVVDDIEAKVPVSLFSKRVRGKQSPSIPGLSEKDCNFCWWLLNK